MRVVAVLNQKGGVGKTTTAVNLGAALALRENEVLLIDLDPQGNLTDHLGLDPEAEDSEADRPSAYDVLMGEAALRDAVLPTGTPHLSVLPSHQDLAAVELELAGVPGREHRLKEALAKLPPKSYDWVLIDCPPSLGLLSLNAMAAAREVFITLQTEYFALRGLGQLDKIVSMVREQVNPQLVISGIVATLVDPVTNLAREVVDEVKSVYGHRVFATRIRKNVRLAEAPGHQSHIFAYAPTSTGAADYHALADEVEAWDPTSGTTPPTVAKKPAVPVAIPVEEPTRRQNAPKAKAGAAASAPAAKPAAAPAAKPAAPLQPAAGARVTPQPTAKPVPAPAAKAVTAPAAKAVTAPAAKAVTAPAAKAAAAPESAAEAKRPAAPAGPPRTTGGTFAPRSASPTPAPAPGAPAKPAPTAKPSAPARPEPPAKAAAPAPSASPGTAAGSTAASSTPASSTPASRATPPAAPAKEPSRSAEPKAGASKATTPPAPGPAKATPSPAKAATAAPARPAVPSPALRNPRPWMKPAGK